jgi:DNA-binding NtrC family response regulator
MAGEEVLVADANSRDRAGIVALLEKSGLVASEVESASVGRERVTGKFFPLAVIDMDLPGGGVEMLEFIHERSRGTQVVMLTSRKNFDGAVHCYRAGCVDVVFKRPEELPRLERAIDTALERYRSAETDANDELMRVLDDMVKLIVALARQVYAGEIDSLTETSRAQLNVLFVDDDTRFLKEVSEQVATLPMDGFVEMSGGGALDKIGEHSFDVVIAKEALSDLPGTIAVNGAQQKNEACVALLYTSPGASGRIERVFEGKVTDTFTPFRGAKDLADRVRQLVEEEHARRRERKVLQVIGSKHSDTFRKYAELKRRLGARG